jgi:large subunit ribosomal protein L17
MRHRKLDKKFGRSPSHRKALFAHLVCSLIEEKRIKTTLPKARVARTMAEKMVTLGRKGSLAARRSAIAQLRQERIVKKLIDEIVPSFDGRQGGYTRITKLGRRGSDGSDMAILEWVDIKVPDKRRKKTTEATEKTETSEKTE